MICRCFFHNFFCVFVVAVVVVAAPAPAVVVLVVVVVIVAAAAVLAAVVAAARTTEVCFGISFSLFAFIFNLATAINKEKYFRFFNLKRCPFRHQNHNGGLDI